MCKKGQTKNRLDLILKAKCIIWHMWAGNLLSKQKGVITWAKWQARHFSTVCMSSLLNLSSIAFRIFKVWEVGCYFRPPRCVFLLQYQRLQSQTKTHKISSLFRKIPSPLIVNKPLLLCSSYIFGLLTMTGWNCC